MAFDVSYEVPQPVIRDRETFGRGKSSWPRLHRLSRLVVAVLCVSWVTLNLPLEPWAEMKARQASALAGESSMTSMWIGWPRRWYVVQAGERMSIEEVEVGDLAFNVVAMACLLLAAVTATEVLMIRHVGGISHPSGLFVVALVGAAFTFVLMQSVDMSDGLVNIVVLVQESARYTIYSLVFVSWFGLFRWLTRARSG